jgi:hypothetical protein
MPVTVGLVMASAALLIGTTSTDWGIAAITVIAAVLFLLTRLHPLLVPPRSRGARGGWNHDVTK